MSETPGYFKKRVKQVLDSSVCRCSVCGILYETGYELNEKEPLGSQWKYPLSSEAREDLVDEKKSPKKKKRKKDEKPIKCDHTVCNQCVSQRKEDDHPFTVKKFTTGFCRCPVEGCEADNAFCMLKLIKNTALAELIGEVRLLDDNDNPLHTDDYFQEGLDRILNSECMACMVCFQPYETEVNDDHHYPISSLAKKLKTTEANPTPTICNHTVCIQCINERATRNKWIACPVPNCGATKAFEPKNVIRNKALVGLIVELRKIREDREEPT
jgi:uncharacterized protein (UPF0212 family)